MLNEEKPTAPKRPAKASPLRLAVWVAALAALVGVALVVRQLRKVPARSANPNDTLTDVAGRSPETDVRGAESPSRRASQGGSARRPQAPPAKVVMPELMPDPAHPPQWTAPRAMPPPPKPPDPFVPPPVAVDPSPGHHTNSE